METEKTYKPYKNPGKDFKPKIPEEIVSGPTRKPDPNAEAYPEHISYEKQGGEKMSEDEDSEESENENEEEIEEDYDSEEED